MKKVFAYLRSMKFGMLLLAAILLLSFAGSLIPQKLERSEYASMYSDAAAGVIMAARFDDVFQTPYFIAILALLCLNLALCSIPRYKFARRAGAALASRCAASQTERPLDGDQAEKLVALLKRRRFKARETDGQTVYLRDLSGFYGSFVTHLALILILAVGGLVLTVGEISDRGVLPGETLRLEDGLSVRVDSFRFRDESGRLDYSSVVDIVLPDGRESGEKFIRVNEPARFGDYKIYQQTYGTAASILITNDLNGASEIVNLTDQAMLSADGRTGIYFARLYPGYTRNADGGYTLISSTSAEYPDPVYSILVMDGARTRSTLLLPGESEKVGDITYTMLPPVEYPGLRIKRMPPIPMAALYFAFALMICGLFLCFFHVPCAVKVESSGFALISPKAQTGLTLDIDSAINARRDE